MARSNPFGTLRDEGLMGKFHKSKLTASGKPHTVGELFSEQDVQVGEPLLVLNFMDGQQPVLKWISFQAYNQAQQRKLHFKGRNKETSFTWTTVFQALSLLFIEYRCAGLEGRIDSFEFTGQKGGLAAAICYRLALREGKIFTLFSNGQECLIPQIFGEQNTYAPDGVLRIIHIRNNYLPPERVRILLNESELNEAAALRVFGDRIRVAWQLEASSQPAPPKTEEDVPPKKVDARPVEEKEQSSASPAPSAKAEPSQSKPSSTPGPPASDSTKVYEVPSSLYAISNPEGHEWHDSEGLINFGTPGTEEDHWRISDACKSVLVLGAPGSGKTSSSGSLFAKTFLESGFGVLVLTVKTEEAERWVSLCSRFGRAADCIRVKPGGPYRLNAIAYESQRPGDRIGLTEDLLSFLRVLLTVMAQGDSREISLDKFWREATDELLRAAMTLFLLAREPITLEGLVLFLNSAPLDPATEWKRIPFFADIIARAEQNATLEQQSDLASSRYYWTIHFPTRIPNDTRGCVIAGVSAMAAALQAPGIRQILCTETTVTPESILSGRVVIMDMSTKGSGKGALMVQAAWKFLLQRAIERRADKGQSTARPCVIWEDEGHVFFSPHDFEFQPSARDCRGARVVISQNLHNFYKMGYGEHSVMSVLSSIGTYVLHHNPDHLTNMWIANILGEVSDFATRFNEPENQGFFDSKLWRPLIDRPKLTEISRPAITQRDFLSLKVGGDGTCEAYVVWLAHKFRRSGGHCFIKMTFNQDNGD